MQNPRILLAPTAALRIAAVCVDLMTRMEKNHGRLPDYRDFTKELEPHLLREELNWRADEARTSRESSITERIASLNRQAGAIQYNDDH